MPKTRFSLARRDDGLFLAVLLKFSHPPAKSLIPEIHHVKLMTYRRMQRAPRYKTG